MSEPEAGWNSNKERLLCMMVLDDDLAPALSPLAGPAFWRAFIVQNRKTGEVLVKFRFKYKNGERSWYAVTAKDKQNAEAEATRLRCGLEDVLRLALRAVPLDIDPERVDHAVQCFYPPDDEGDPGKTIIWLEQRDLIEITKFIPPKGSES